VKKLLMITAILICMTLLVSSCCKTHKPEGEGVKTPSGPTQPYDPHKPPPVEYSDK